MKKNGKEIASDGRIRDNKCLYLASGGGERKCAVQEAQACIMGVGGLLLLERIGHYKT